MVKNTPVRITSETDCEFCLEFANPEGSFFCNLFESYGLKNRVLEETDLFIAIAGLGALVEGYVLILPKDHYTCLSQLSTFETARLVDFKKIIMDRMRLCYSDLICFEHGAVSGHKRGGACLDHAHLHICPCPTDLSFNIQTDFAANQIETLYDLGSLLNGTDNQPYVFYENQSGKMKMYFVPDQIKSQYMRRLWASALGMSSRWDWAAYIGEDNILNTIGKMKPQLFV